MMLLRLLHWALRIRTLPSGTPGGPLAPLRPPTLREAISGVSDT
jgi:hypothetical protein